jgi:hypothetical protein
MLDTAAYAGGSYAIRASATSADGSVSDTASVTIDNSTDADMDGLVDGWELFCFGDLSATTDGDPDGDGATNGEELNDATDPGDAASVRVDDTGGEGSGIYRASLERAVSTRRPARWRGCLRGAQFSFGSGRHQQHTVVERNDAAFWRPDYSVPPYSRSTSAASLCWYFTARSRGVSRESVIAVYLVKAFALAPCSRSSLTLSAWPYSAAIWSGV